VAIASSQELPKYRPERYHCTDLLDYTVYWDVTETHYRVAE